jgi:ribosomal protein S13
MKDLKHIKRFNEATENLNISDVSNSVFSITEEQLEKLIDKVQNNIKDKLNKKGEYSLSSDLSQSVSDTIKHFLKKHCG